MLSLKMHKTICDVNSASLVREESQRKQISMRRALNSANSFFMKITEIHNCNKIFKKKTNDSTLSYILRKKNDVR